MLAANARLKRRSFAPRDPGLALTRPVSGSVEEGLDSGMKPDAAAGLQPLMEWQGGVERGRRREGLEQPFFLDFISA